MSKLNIELFRKIRERIAMVPESYWQSDWCALSDEAPCGTTACLAGEAIICDAPTVAEGVARLHGMTGRQIASTAASLLGLTGDYHIPPQGETAIFHSRAVAWPKPFREQFEAGDETGAALGFLDWVIKTGKVLE